MEVLQEVFRWLTDPANWSGPDGIPNRTWEHVRLSVVSVGMATMLALPVGLLIGHTRRGAFAVIAIGNLGRAIPSFGILALTLPLALDLGLGLGFWPAIIALFFLAIPPILTNAYVGVAGVDPDTLEAVRGMGMTEREVLLRLELPLAAPLIAAGLRTAAVQVVATATLAALVAGGGLGLFIIRGFRVGDDARIVGGAILVALLAIATELGMALLERAVRPRTSSRRRAGVTPPAFEAVGPPVSPA